MIGPPRWADRYIGLPFCDLGFDRSGVHCWGLAVMIYRGELAIDLPRYDFISARDLVRAANRIEIERIIGPWVEVSEIREFDVILMRSTIAGVAHIGVAASPRHVLHVHRGADSACVPIGHDTIRRRGSIVGCYRHEALHHGRGRDYSAVQAG